MIVPGFCRTYPPVWTAALHELLALAPQGLRPRQHRAHGPASDQAHQIWFWLDDHGDFVFPLLGLAIVTLLILGIRRGMTSNLAELQQKQDRKDEIVRMMRKKLLVTADAIAGDLGIDRFAASALLEELLREGKLLEQRSTGGPASYRLKGL